MKPFSAIIVVTMLLLAAANGRCALHVVSTIPDFGDLAAQVGGNRVSVTALVRPTQDPHFLDAKPSFLLSLHQADILLYTGMELEEGWLPPLLQGARNRTIQKGGAGHVDCSRFIEPMDVRAPDRAMGDIHPGGNPHYWTDPRNGLRIAMGIRDALCRLDGAHCDEYHRNAAAFEKKLNAKMKEWKTALGQVSGRRVYVYHESWVYFLDFAGLVQSGAIEPRPGVPPPPSHAAALITRAREEHIRLILQESWYPVSTSRLIAQKAEIRLAVLPTMVGAAGTRDYIQLIDAIVKEVIK
jgi:zinc/manganese transport system substrate-binding protein